MLSAPVPVMEALLGSAVFVLLAAGFCAAHEWASGRATPASASLAWATVTFVPWLFAFEVGKRLGRGTSLVGARLGFLVAACTGCGLLSSLVLERLFALSFFDVEFDPLAQDLVDRAPALAAFALALLVGLAGGRGRPSTAADVKSASCADAHLPFDSLLLRWARAGGNYVEFRIGDRSVMHRITMHEVEKLLDAAEFVRLHRSFIVRRSEIAATGRDKNSYFVKLTDGTVHAVGPAYAHRLPGNDPTD